MYDWLDEMSEEVLPAHPLKVRAIASARIKNDRIDSEVLAHVLRANLIPAAHALSREIRALRRVLRQRMFFVQLRIPGHMDEGFRQNVNKDSGDVNKGFREKVDGKMSRIGKSIHMPERWSRGSFIFRRERRWT